MQNCPIFTGKKENKGAERGGSNGEGGNKSEEGKGMMKADGYDEQLAASIESRRLYPKPVEDLPSKV